MTPELTIRPPLRLGDTAPDFVSRSTHGPVRLSDYRGRWLVFFMHPADFTPVCTSEFVALARDADTFAQMDCALLGLSVDSLFSHLAWLRAIHDRFGVEITFPVIEDPTLEIARTFGMLPPDAMDASTVRSTMIVDPAGVLRASMAYPVEVGRSIPEIIRTVRALQRVHGGGIVAPADWKPGDDLLREPDQDVAAIMACNEASGWFYQPVPDAG